MVDGWRIAIAGAATFVIVAALVPLVRRFAIARGITDNPEQGKAHASPTPYLGGVAIALGAVVCSLALPGWKGQAGAIVAAAVLVARDRTVRRHPYREAEPAPPRGSHRGCRRGRRRSAGAPVRRTASTT